MLVSVPEPLRSLILSPAARAKLEGLAQVTYNEDGRDWTQAELAARLPGIDVLITSWGVVELDESVLAGADRLRLVAHSAGSVRKFVTDALYDRGICVTHAAGRIADSVAEFSLLLALTGLRQAHVQDRKIKAGGWPKVRGEPVFEIAGKRVGVLGMGYVGRRSARLFRAVGAEVWAFDPYLSAQAAAELGVRKAGLDEVFRECHIVSVHLPVTDETRRMIGKQQFALLRDGAIFINTARSLVVDQDAMLAELQTGRIWAALDVFDKEPLAEESPFRRLENVHLTPHVAGLTIDSYQGLIALAVDEIERFKNGQPLAYPVTREMLATMA